MLVIVGRTHYLVTWIHVNPLAPFRVNPVDEKIRRTETQSPTRTVCSVEKRSGKNQGAEAWDVAFLHPKEATSKVFDADKGRLLSMGRALRKIRRLTKSSRKLFYDRYFGQV